MSIRMMDHAQSVLLERCILEIRVSPLYSSKFVMVDDRAYISITTARENKRVGEIRIRSAREEASYDE